MDRTAHERHSNRFASRVPLEILIVVVVIAGLWSTHRLSAPSIEAARLEFDRTNLAQLFEPGSYDNDPATDTFRLDAAPEQDRMVNRQLLGLRVDRLAYIARKHGQVVAVAVPATAEDGFNGYVDLLVGIDAVGYITHARVVRELRSRELSGIVDIINSRWMENFSGESMREVKRVTWQSIAPEQEYDQFVGASLTPKSVANKIYDVLVFFQSNRIVLMTSQDR